MELLYFLPWVVTVSLQVFFAVHAARTGRYFWIFIIFFFPWVGFLVYFFVEFLPNLRARGTIESVSRDVARRINPAAEIRRLEDQVALSNTVNNRMELARAYLRAGRTDDAIRTYESCAQGIYATDPRLLYELSAAYYQNDQLAEARETFDKLRRETNPTPDQLLLSARIHEDAGDLDAALREYQYLAGRATGEEARTRYALLLKQVGREGEAYEVFDQIVRHSRVSSSHYRKEQKEWIETAKRELKAREGAGA